MERQNLLISKNYFEVNRKAIMLARDVQQKVWHFPKKI